MPQIIIDNHGEILVDPETCEILVLSEELDEIDLSFLWDEANEH